MTPPIHCRLSFIVYAGFPLNASGGLATRHTNGLNIGFIDGHAKYYPIGNVYANQPSASATLTDVAAGGMVAAH